MYVPAHYRTDDPAAILGWLARFPFGTLVTAGADGLPLATSLPVITEDQGITEGQGITEDQAPQDITGLTIAAHMARRHRPFGVRPEISGVLKVTVLQRQRRVVLL